MIQTCLSILTRALAGVGVYKIQKHTDKKTQTTQNPLPSFEDEQSFSKPYSAEDVANFIIDYVNVELGGIRSLRLKSKKKKLFASKSLSGYHELLNVNIV